MNEGKMAAHEKNPGCVACGYPDRSITRVGVSKQEFPMHSSSPATRVEREGPNFQNKKINNNDNKKKKNTKSVLAASSVGVQRDTTIFLTLAPRNRLINILVTRSWLGTNI